MDLTLHLTLDTIIVTIQTIASCVTKASLAHIISCAIMVSFVHIIACSMKGSLVHIITWDKQRQDQGTPIIITQLEEFKVFKNS